MFLKFMCCGLVIFTFLVNTALPSSPQEKLVEKWADKLGGELWSLGKLITKSLDIKSRYEFLNAQVERKNPERLLQEIVKSISRMMDRKMDAIRCIAFGAEEFAEQFEYNSSTTFFQYYSSKYSPVQGEEPVELPESLQPNQDMYKEMVLNNDTHFYNLPVNTSYSSVHVPTNVYDKYKDAQIAIQWSENLDAVFLQNYNSDPALSWQYFGSSSGIMRHYPAMKWMELQNDLFDCRIRTWFIEASTCTKDVIILLDNSGSMQGMGKHIAALTVSSILDTFSNNDYINILSYNVTTKFVVPCFENLLVQATRENIEIFNKAVQELVPDERSNLIDALELGFELLETYRIRKNCTEANADCNQAIMLITDGVPGDLTPVIQKHNLLNNGSSIPVRIFTYLIGVEVTNVEELRAMACENRGYYSQVQALEQVTWSVFQYIPVIARPLVLEGTSTGIHPVSWTHAYTDITYDDSKDDQINEPYRLLTSAAIPAFDHKVNKNNDTRTADLLGVAGTDVPIDDIQKLTLPYKIGVNGYAFIVSNNGYLLMHPDLRPVYKKKLKKNYSSVDLTEVEQIEDGENLGPRELGSIDRPLRQLRLALVNGIEGTMEKVKLKYHFDDMRRVSLELYDYYYAPIKDTPFSIALAIPSGYGKYSLKVDDEIRRNKHTGTNITSFFEGSNWKIHPKWVYCKYHYLEGHEFKTPEAELMHFLKKIDDDDQNSFKWQLQYEAYGDADKENLDEVECSGTILKDDDYYCDKQLMQRLVFDAKNTMEAFKHPWSFKNDRDKDLFERYNATLRFVATMSGLTRWEYIFGEEENSNKMEFGDLHSKAIDEIWYKSAVLQHQHDKDSFVYSVPFDARDGDPDDLLVTGSYAIFPKDASIEAPGSVVGFQFSHSHLKGNLQAIANKSVTSCPNCLTCNNSLSCYVLDNSGYIVVSYDNNDTGKFFGEVQPDVIDMMLKEEIFIKVTVYDFQALCFYKKEKNVPKAEEEEESTCPCEKKIDLFILQQNKTEYSKKISGIRSFYVKRIPYSNLLFVAVENATTESSKKWITSEEVYCGKVTEHYHCHKISLNDLERRRLTGCFNEHPLEHEIKACGKADQIHIEAVLIMIYINLVLLCKYMYY